MELKKKVRRHIEELTRLAYERGYRDGAQSALAEIEKIAGEDPTKGLKEAPASLEAPAKTAAPDVRRRAALKRQQVQQRKAKPNRVALKATTVQRCIQRLIASRGEARRDEVLAAARSENPSITEPGCAERHPDADAARGDPQISIPKTRVVVLLFSGRTGGADGSRLERPLLARGVRRASRSRPPSLAWLGRRLSPLR